MGELISEEMLRAALAASLLVAMVTGHASMIMPPTRNSIDSTLAPWSNGKHPATGVIDPKAAPCTNGTSPCDSGQGTFWFSQGCTIGCTHCTGNGSRIANFNHCPGTSIQPTLLPKYRTANRASVPGSVADVFKYNPWRAPGEAPVYDSCGMAGGANVPSTAAAEYTTTQFAKQGELGTQVLRPRPTGTIWKRGTVAYARQQSTAPHGGGYIFRLCPANESLTEECFNRVPLEFATPDKHTLRFADSKLDREINATLVTEGGGKGWMVWPWPGGSTGDLMYVVKPGEHCFYPNNTRDNGEGPTVPGRAYCPGCGAPRYLSDGACPCQGQYPAVNISLTCPEVPPHAGSDLRFTPDPAPGHSSSSYALEDGLKVPLDIAAGEWVLSYRWDCEMTSQIWQSCADLTIE